MKVVFAYDFDKDVENLLKGFNSINNKKPTKLQELFLLRNEQLDREHVSTFLSEFQVSSPIELLSAEHTFEQKWQEIAELYFKRVEKLFNIEYPVQSITAYLSTNSRCTYDIPEGYFFLYHQSKEPNATIMHELLHFYTWYAWHERLMAKGLTPQEYNDIKESLTVLLNIEFFDLMNGEVDAGYPQHKEMRDRIAYLWNEHKDLEMVMDQLIP